MFWLAAAAERRSNSTNCNSKARKGPAELILFAAIGCCPARGSVRKAARNPFSPRSCVILSRVKPIARETRPPISPARAAAFDILLRVERESSYASELLHSSTYERLTQVDHSLTTELVMGVLRWRTC